MKHAFWRASIALFHIALGLLLASSLVACSDDGAGETGDEDLEIIGDYLDNFMFEHSISADEWVMGGESIYVIVEFDNQAKYIIAENDASNPFNPELWSRFDWAWEGGQLFFCQSVYDGLTIDDARARGADSSDLMKGCGGFAWSTLTPQ